VSLADLPPSADLARHLATTSEGVRWHVHGKPEALTVNGREAERYFLEGKRGKQAMAHEVVVFRRGGRVYFFTASFPAGDRARRDQARQAVDSVLWGR
jgi:hypothetical protein